MKTAIAWSNSSPPLTTQNVVGLAAVLVLLVFLLQGNTGFNLADEGFLWYGTIRTALGDVPIRDFQSYEPARYYWGALWFKLLRNDGILALRLSQAVFQFVGLTLGLLLLRRLLGSWTALIFAAVILVRWMFPTWKIYEPVILIAAIYFAVLLIEQPSSRRHLAAGVFVGVAAFCGRNHGLYCGVAFLLLSFYLGWGDKGILPQRLGALFLGSVVGYSPMLFMFAFVPEFFNQFTADVLFNLKQGTNLPLPIPWPWRHDYGSLGVREAINRSVIGTLYLAIPAFYLLAFTRLSARRNVPLHPLFVASVFVGVAYLHYTFDRPQLYYVAWTIPAFILGLIALPVSFSGEVRKRVAIFVWSFLVVVSIGALELAQENYFAIKIKEFAKTKLMGHYGGDFTRAMNEQGLVKTDVRGDILWVLRDTATLIDNTRALEPNLIQPQEKIFVAPYLPGLYATMQKQSPVREIYFLLPRALDEQEAMVHDLEKEKVSWALVCEHYVDDRPELQFRITNGAIWNYLSANFEPVPVNLDRHCTLLRRRVK